jgi:hypothetical protein
VLALPSTEVAARLGTYRLTAAVKLVLGSGEAADALDESFRLEVDAAGGSHLVRETSHDQGSEAIAAGGSYYVRTRYGRFAKRAPEGDEVERARDEAEGLLAGYLDVLGRFAARSDGGTGDWKGRAAVKLKLALAAPAPFADPDPAHAWRSTIEVDALDGEVWVDEKTGVVLRELLDARYRSRRDARVVAVTLHFQSDRDALGAIAPITAPADAVSPARPRPLLDRQALLEGLAAGRATKRAAGDPEEKTER